MLSKIVLATHNPGKIREIQQRCGDLASEFIPIDHYTSVEPEETGLTFIENAILKSTFCL